MPLPRLILSTFLLGLIVAAAEIALGQDYPNRPIRLVTSPPGGGNDFMARLVAQGITAPLGQPVVIDNRTTDLMGEVVAKAPPDGYTLLVSGGAFMIAHLLRKATYDSVTDFSPITLIARAPGVLIVHPSLPVRSVKELVALAKTRPGELNYGSGAIGGSTHLAPELFKSMAGINIMRVGYKGTGPALIALMSGDIQLMINSASSAAPYVKSGRLRALAVTSAQPSALAPGLPTVAASGLPGYEVVSVDAIFAPAKTPAAIINRLNQEIVKALHKPDVKQKLFDTGVEVVGSSPAELEKITKSEIALWGKVIKNAGFGVE